MLHHPSSEARTMNPNDQWLFDLIKQDLQIADELGGCDTAEDYAALMDAVIKECQRRKAAALKEDPS